MEDKSPSTCRLCDVPLAGPEVWRQHAKSEWHIYNLRKRVAQPGTVITPPSTPAPTDSASPRRKSPPVEDKGGLEAESDVEEDEVLPADQPAFEPGQCLFCSRDSRSLDGNLAHMAKAHSFSVPYPEHLHVELETLVAFLHMVIYWYGECILCAARRNTVVGIQDHMKSKGHCRFDVTADFAEFYTFPASAEWQADEESLRLPSGKLLSHRTRSQGVTTVHAARTSPDTRLVSTSNGSASSSAATPGTDLVPASAAQTQLSRLSKGEQQSLAHLSDAQVRSLLTTAAKDVSSSRREQTQAKLRLEKAGNITLFAHFRADTSKRFRGPWG